MTDLDDIRKLHEARLRRVQPGSLTGGVECRTCGQIWPCDVSVETNRVDSAERLAERLCVMLYESGDHHSDCDLNLRPQALTATCDCVWGEAIETYKNIRKSS